MHKCEIVFKVRFKMDHVCLICNESLHRGQVVRDSRGLSSLIKASEERQDGLHVKIKESESIEVHSDCRKNYTRKCSILASLRKKTVVDSVHDLEKPSVSPLYDLT